MHILYIRIICMVILFLISGFCFLIPLFIKRLLVKREKVFNIITSVLNCLSSGIFFGVITLDLWPAAIEEFNEEISERKIDVKFPYAELCIGLGFFFVYLIEEFQDYFIKFFNFLSHTKCCTSLRNKCKFRKNSENAAEKVACKVNGDNRAFIFNEALVENKNENESKSEEKMTDTNLDTKFEVKLDIENNKISNNEHSNHDHNHNHGHSHDQSHGHSHSHGSSHTIQENAFIILLSLSAHSFFDGIILGVKGSEKDMWSFLFIVVLHHSIMSFSVGNILSTKVKMNENSKITNKILLKHLIMTFVWSMIIPLGIFITIFKAHIDKLIIAILMNIATGSFLYITFIELLPQTIIDLNLPYKLDIIFIIIGYIIVCILEYIGE